MFLGLRRLLNGWSLVRIRPGANKIKYFFDNENRLGGYIWGHKMQGSRSNIIMCMPSRSSGRPHNGPAASFAAQPVFL